MFCQSPAHGWAVFNMHSPSDNEILKFIVDRLHGKLPMLALPALLEDRFGRQVIVCAFAALCN